jgi:hypothetical protein
MVRRGSTVRVRQRALGKRRTSEPSRSERLARELNTPCEPLLGDRDPVLPCADVNSHPRSQFHEVSPGRQTCVLCVYLRLVGFDYVCAEFLRLSARVLMAASASSNAACVSRSTLRISGISRPEKCWNCLGRERSAASGSISTWWRTSNKPGMRIRPFQASPRAGSDRSRRRSRSRTATISSRPSRAGFSVRRGPLPDTWVVDHEAVQVDDKLAPEVAFERLVEVAAATRIARQPRVALLG